MQWYRADQEQEMMDYTNSQIASVIDELIHSSRDREMLKRRYIDGVPFEALAEEFDLSVRHCKRIVYKQSEVLFRHL